MSCNSDCKPRNIYEDILEDIHKVPNFKVKPIAFSLKMYLKCFLKYLINLHKSQYSLCALKILRIIQIIIIIKSFLYWHSLNQLSRLLLRKLEFSSL